jgi:hypothetical protein
MEELENKIEINVEDNVENAKFLKINKVPVVRTKAKDKAKAKQRAKPKPKPKESDKIIEDYRFDYEKDIDNKLSYLEEVLGREINPYQQERIKVVALEIMHGLSPQQIALKYCDKWGIGASTINSRLMADARKFIASQILTEDNDIRLDLTGKYYFLYQKNIEANDLPEARKVLDSLSNLIKKIEHKVDIVSNIKTIVLEEYSNQNINLIDNE